MIHVILVIHLILAVSIIGLVLIQRSEGGGLGIGGGGLGGLASPQSTASVLSRATGICAALFFVTSLTLGVLSSHNSPKSITDHLENITASQDAPTEEAKGEAGKAETPSVPVAE
ncbi:MAG: preprotein translocase subunit SecG [Alphaproteobacteria bacterium]|nr:preprotein translocase subunit SecG [Alphaproteobacteria bacterium]